MKKFLLGLVASCFVLFLTADTAKAEHRSRSCDNDRGYSRHYRGHYDHGHHHHHHHHGGYYRSHHYNYRPSGFYFNYPSYSRGCYDNYNYGYGGSRIGFYIGF